MSDNGQNAKTVMPPEHKTPPPRTTTEHKTIRGETRTARLRRARVWALVRLKGMTPSEAYRTVPGGRARDAKNYGQAMVDAFEMEAGDSLEVALTAADLGMARLLREIDSSLKSEKPQTYNAALRLLAELHKRPTITAPTVSPITVERGVVVTPSELSAEDWTRQHRSPK